MKIKEIELVFENCDGIRLKPNMFKNLSLHGIKTDKNINCYQFEKGEETNMTTCEYFHISVIDEGLWQGGYIGREPLRERVEGCDITAIKLVYSKRKEKDIYVPWDDNNDYTNKYQKNKYDIWNDRLEITITKE